MLHLQSSKLSGMGEKQVILEPEVTRQVLRMHALYVRLLLRPKLYKCIYVRGDNLTWKQPLCPSGNTFSCCNISMSQIKSNEMHKASRPAFICRTCHRKGEFIYPLFPSPTEIVIASVKLPVYRLFYHLFLLFFHQKENISEICLD